MRPRILLLLFLLPLPGGVLSSAPATGAANPFAGGGGAVEDSFTGGADFSGETSLFGGGGEADPVSAALVAELFTVEPGETFKAALKLEHKEGWHTYWRNPGDSGFATYIDWQLPEGIEVGEIEWPQPHVYDPAGPGIAYVHDGVTYLPFSVTVPGDLEAGATVTLSGKANWLVCDDDQCFPGDEDVSLTLEVGDASERNETISEAIAAAMETFPEAMPAWEVKAVRKGEFYEMKILRADKAAAEDVEDIRFFGFSSTLLNASAEQNVTPIEDGYQLRLERSEYAKPDEDTISGVLFSESGWLAGDPDSKEMLVDVEPGFEAAPAPALPLLLLFGFIGGLILNLMPCVFPVLGLKIMNFVEQAGQERKKVIAHGLIFTAGVLISFWILVAILMVLREGGDELGWGFQMQSPGFVFFLTLLLFVFGLNLAGLFEVGTSATGMGGNLVSKKGFGGSFFSGVLAVIVATPCAAPFLAPALGAALTLNAVSSLLVFTCIGLGLSSPYLLLSAFPALERFLPRPGAWMETFKQAMSFLLFATVGYLLWVLAGQVEGFAFLFTLLALVLAALACWILGRWDMYNRPKSTRRKALVSAIVVFALSVYLGLPSRSATEWQQWSPQAQEELLALGRPVYIDFTARWCLTCQTNKLAYTKEVQDAFIANDVATLKADWGDRNTLIARELAKYGTNSIPFNVLLVPDRDEPITFPRLLTPGVIKKKLQELKPDAQTGISGPDTGRNPLAAARL